MTNQPTNTKRNVLLTGAAGRIGTAFREFVADQYNLRLADRTIDNLNDPYNFEAIEMDIVDLDACQRLCQGIDTVVHLAGDPSGKAGFYGSLLDNNFKGTYNVFQAAFDQGCRRVIFASSVQAISGYPLDVQAHPESPVKPLNMYAVSKCFGEAVAHCFASQGLSGIAIRVGSFEGNPGMSRQNPPNARNLSTFVSKRDLSHLIVRCIETPDVPFAIVHGVSNNRFKRMDITSTKQIFDYQPQDDAFQRFGIGIPYQDRWYDESGLSKPEAANE